MSKRSWFLGGLCGVFLVLWCFGGRYGETVASGGGRPPVFALLIGIQDYRHRGYSDLVYTKNDVLGLRDALVRHGGVSSGNVRVLLNKKATKSAIRKAITQWLAGELGKRKNHNATVILFFAGHGESYDGMSYWLPYDVKKGKQHLEDTALSSDHVNGWLRKLNTSRVVVFADACHSGSWSSGGRGGRRRGARGKTSSKSFGVGGFGEGFVRISSSQRDQLSWEVDELKHGLFTYALIQGLKGAAHRSRKGAVTVGTLMAYLEEEVEALSKKYNKDLQRPVREGVSAGALPLSYPRQSAAVVAPTIVETPAATTTVETPAAPTVVETPAVVKEPTAGERKTFTVGGASFAMRWIPSGSFMMGYDGSGYDSEKPQRRVKISKGFWMLESEVTQGQYKALMGSNPSHFSSCGDNCPVESVGWHNARAFANKLSVAQGQAACTATDRDLFQCVGWRLPTEAEWEYAARAGTTGARHGELDDVAWYRGNSGNKTHPVGEKEANAWGLRDMLGNVMEWTMDVYGDYAGMPTRDPLRTSGGAGRVYRGGSWGDDARSVRSANRGNGVAPSLRNDDLGFRLLRY